MRGIELGCYSGLTHPMNSFSSINHNTRLCGSTFENLKMSSRNYQERMTTGIECDQISILYVHL